MIGKYRIDMIVGKNGKTAYRICDTETNEMLPGEYPFETLAILDVLSFYV